MLSSTQQMVDKLVAQTQETLKTISLDANHNKCDLENASKVMRDAENSKHVCQVDTVGMMIYLGVRVMLVCFFLIVVVIFT